MSDHEVCISPTLVGHPVSIIPVVNDPILDRAFNRVFEFESFNATTSPEGWLYGVEV